MKTYNQIIQKPCLTISYDGGNESPRSWDNLGYFFTKQNQYKSPDGNTHELYNIMLEAEDISTNATEHMNNIKKLAKKQNIKITYITPVCRYEYGNIVYKRGTATGFDYSNCGFYIITDEQTEKHTKTEIEKIIDGELDTYTKWCNGEVYQFELMNEKGEYRDSCGGFYNIEDIMEYLPEEYKGEDLTKYLV